MDTVFVFITLQRIGILSMLLLPFLFLGTIIFSIALNQYANRRLMRRIIHAWPATGDPSSQFHSLLFAVKKVSQKPRS